MSNLLNEFIDNYGDSNNIEEVEIIDFIGKPEELPKDLSSLSNLKILNIISKSVEIDELPKSLEKLKVQSDNVHIKNIPVEKLKLVDISGSGVINTPYSLILDKVDIVNINNEKIDFKDFDNRYIDFFKDITNNIYKDGIYNKPNFQKYLDKTLIYFKKRANSIRYNEIKNIDINATDEFIPYEILIFNLDSININKRSLKTNEYKINLFPIFYKDIENKNLYNHIKIPRIIEKKIDKDIDKTLSFLKVSKYDSDILKNLIKLYNSLDENRASPYRFKILKTFKYDIEDILKTNSIKEKEI